MISNIDCYRWYFDILQPIVQWLFGAGRSTWLWLKSEGEASSGCFWDHFEIRPRKLWRCVPLSKVIVHLQELYRIGWRIDHLCPPQIAYKQKHNKWRPCLFTLEVFFVHHLMAWLWLGTFHELISRASNAQWFLAFAVGNLWHRNPSA